MSLVGTLIPLLGAGVLGGLAWGAAIFSRRQVAQHRSELATAVREASVEDIVKAAIVDPVDLTSVSGVRIINRADSPGIVKTGKPTIVYKRWVYRDASGARIEDGENIRPYTAFTPKPDPIG